MRRRAVAVPVLLVAGLLAGCSGGGDDPAPEAGEPGSETPSSTAPTDYLPVPDGVELTAQGSELAVGDTATVAYEPRQGDIGVLDIKVTRLEKTSFKKSFEGWDLDAQTRKSTPYFVRATVTNRGETDLGGRAVPLYVVDGNNRLLEATPFASSFKQCEPRTFPEKFRPGKTLKACMVYLAPDKGDLVAVSFRPTQEYEPITWTGELKEPRPAKKDKKRKGQANQGAD